jgi:hypothetical protein
MGMIRRTRASMMMVTMFLYLRPICQSDLLTSAGFTLHTFRVEFLSLVLRQLHFLNLTYGGLLDRTKSQAPILELGYVLQGLPCTFSSLP